MDGGKASGQRKAGQAVVKPKEKAIWCVPISFFTTKWSSSSSSLESKWPSFAFCLVTKNQTFKRLTFLESKEAQVRLIRKSKFQSPTMYQIWIKMATWQDLTISFLSCRRPVFLCSRVKSSKRLFRQRSLDLALLLSAKPWPCSCSEAGDLC